MELLAPAGNVDNFYAALQAGADAVYLGAPGINARNLSRDLTYAEIGAMIDYAHEHEKKVYLAANSLILERDFKQLIKTVSLLDALHPDGFIIQDLGLLRLFRLHFPHLKLHASTLMGVCSSSGVNLLCKLGCRRVVLARELTLKEIKLIKKNVSAELEIFVHGAMCYSFSGYCLFSSFLGGKSGMRGRCVQPCRREYGWQGHGGKKKSTGSNRKTKAGGYVFSMNDLAGFACIAALKETGIASVKIEGRLRSANYVSRIVEAYRLVIDAQPDQQELAIEEAEKLAEEAMSRRTSSGYFFSPQPQEAITPQLSGNMGIQLGSFSAISVIDNETFATFSLKAELNVGDRLRLHYRINGQREAFSLHWLLIDGKEQTSGPAGTSVTVLLPSMSHSFPGGTVDVFKLDVGENPIGKKVLAPRIKKAQEKNQSLERELKSRIFHIQQKVVDPRSRGKAGPQSRKRGQHGVVNAVNAKKPEIWLKSDSIKLVTSRLPFAPDKLLLSMHKKMISQSGTLKKYLGKKIRDVIWALPPIILERDISRWSKSIDMLVRSGFRSFQLGHFSQQRLFTQSNLFLYTDYTFNVANSQSLKFLLELGFSGTQLAVELDREAITRALGGYRFAFQGEKRQPKSSGFKIGMTVYGTVPLFTARLLGKHMQLNRSVVSPKNERFVVKKQDGLVVTIPEQPFSLLPYQHELHQIGIDYVVVDTTLMHTSGREMENLAARINVTGKYKKLSTFNYLGKLA